MVRMVQFLLLTSLLQVVFSAVSITSISASTTVYFDFSVTVGIGTGECSSETLQLSSNLGTLQGTTSQTIDGTTTSYSFTGLYLNTAGTATITASCSSTSNSDTDTITVYQGVLQVSLSATVTTI